LFTECEIFFSCHFIFVFEFLLSKTVNLFQALTEIFDAVFHKMNGSVFSFY
jgi:hypothetical protein